MHRLMPWWLLCFINRHSGYCWTAMVMWKLGYGWEWERMTDCEIYKDMSCYCGKRVRE